MEPQQQQPYLPPFPPEQPKRRVSKKAIIIASLITVLLIGGGVIAYLLLNKPPTDDGKKADPTVVVPDTSKDFGACTVLTKDQIVTALGDKASTLHDGYNSGRLFYSGSVEAQYCSYNFTSDAAAGNVKVEVAVNNSQADIDTAKQQFAENSEVSKVSVGNKDGFSFAHTDQVDPNAARVQHFVLTFFSGTTQYTLSINQPEETARFDEKSAQKALLSLAEKIN